MSNSTDTDILRWRWIIRTWIRSRTSVLQLEFKNKFQAYD